jgi:3-oxoacyl-[acyl-carrier protein] reductase
VNAPLQGRAALVTGVSRRAGIGYAVTRRLTDLGARVFIHSFSPHDAEQPWGADVDGPEVLARQLRDEGRRVSHLEADFAHADTPGIVIDAARAAFGHLDIVVANHARSSARPLERVTAAEIDLTFAVNTRATLLLIKEFAAHHDGRPGGRVIMITSGQHRGAMPDELPYVASKGAIHQLTPSLAAHLAPRGITLNTIDPGATDTGYATPEVHRLVLEREPQGRWGEPDDAARVIAWLATDDARWITGQVIASTGGGP